ncbi:MAG: glutamine synthetase family protein [Solirubrobacterales bacterium]
MKALPKSSAWGRVGVAEAELAEFLEDGQIHTVEVCTVDLTGVIRGKRVPVDEFLACLSRGVALSSAIFVFDHAADLVDHSFSDWSNGFPDVSLIPDLESLRIIPWRPGYALVWCDVVTKDGLPVEISPRRVLRRAVESAREIGLSPKVGAELEFYVLDRESKKPALDRIPCYGVDDGEGIEPLVAEIRRSLAGAGVVIQSSNAEYSPGQVEVNALYADALRAADDAMVLRYGAQAVAATFGASATFMAKPFAELSGSGLHIHLSMWDEAECTNLFADDGSGELLSKVGEQALAGVVANLPDFLAVSSPTPNAFRRLAPYSFAPTNSSWGVDNRTVAVRVIGADSLGARIEMREAAADANPYLVIAAHIGAACDGVRRELPCPPAVSGDGYANEHVEPLPPDLRAAAARFSESSLAAGVFGSEFVSMFGAICARECELEAADVSEWQRLRYLRSA